MATNPYFPGKYTQGTPQEQDFIEELIIESIDIMGIDVYYIPRKWFDTSSILGEDRFSSYEKYVKMQMYVENTMSFEGQGTFMSKFGIEIRDQVSLILSKRVFNNICVNSNNPFNSTRPNEGDLVYMPLTNGLFEIKFVEHESVFYNIGKLFVYKLVCERYEYSHENFDTGVALIDEGMTPDINIDFEELENSNPFADNYTIETVNEANIDTGFIHNNPVLGRK